DWDMITDASGNAVIVFNDDQVAPGGVQQISAVKLSPAGAGIWEKAVTSITAGAPTPHVCQLVDGGYAVGYTTGTPSTGGVQRLDPSGNTVGSPVTISEASRAIFFCDIKPSGAGYIASWMRANGTNSVTSNKGLQFQKYDINGVA